jgi:hypothetical protein
MCVSGVCGSPARFDQKMPLTEWVFFSFWPKTGGIAPKPTQLSRFFGKIAGWAENKVRRRGLSS